MASIQPISLLQKAVGSKVWVIMRAQQQVTGTLRGFDDYFNMVLDNVLILKAGQAVQPDRIESLLLNGHDIAFVVPGVDPTTEPKQ